MLEMEVQEYVTLCSYKLWLIFILGISDTISCTLGKHMWLPSFIGKL